MFHFRGKSAALAAATILVLMAASSARANSERVLYTFTGGADKRAPYIGCRRGRENVLYSFIGGEDGAIPSTLIMDQSGNLYGTTGVSGANNAGVVFKVNNSAQPAGP